MAVKGRSLVDQASKRLTEMGVDHSVFMANDKRFNPDKQIQICSVDTLRSRGVAPKADIVIIDEAHTAISSSFKNFLEFYPDSYWLSVTATPWAKGGLKHLANIVVYPISLGELVDQKYLVPAKYFAPTEFDISQVKIKNGEFDEESAMVQFKKQSVYGDVIASYQQKCKGEPTFCFAINVAHAELLQRYFSENEIKSVVITAITTLVERQFLIDALVKSEIDIIISIGTMTTGVDVPALKNIILCRPTQSKNLYVQMLGRGTRPHDNKDHFKVIDHVGNVARHGFLIDEQKVDLNAKEEKRKSSKSRVAPIKTCKKCFAVMKIHEKKCDQCGHVFETTPDLPKDRGGELKELDLDLPSRMRLRAKFFTFTAWSWGYKVGFIYKKLLDEFGEDAMRKYYKVYRQYKQQFEDWQHGRTPAPCAYASAKAERDALFSRLETD